MLHREEAGEPGISLENRESHWRTRNLAQAGPFPLPANLSLHPWMKLLLREAGRAGREQGGRSDSREFQRREWALGWGQEERGDPQGCSHGIPAEESSGWHLWDQSRSQSRGRLSLFFPWSIPASLDAIKAWSDQTHPDPMESHPSRVRRVRDSPGGADPCGSLDPAAAAPWPGCLWNSTRTRGPAGTGGSQRLSSVPAPPSRKIPSLESLAAAQGEKQGSSSSKKKAGKRANPGFSSADPADPAPPSKGNNLQHPKKSRGSVRVPRSH